MLAGTDTAARRIWLVKPYVSLAGNPAVAEYTTLTRSTARRHARRL
jgi:hypothetical protein